MSISTIYMSTDLLDNFMEELTKDDRAEIKYKINRKAKRRNNGKKFVQVHKQDPVQKQKKVLHKCTCPE